MRTTKKILSVFLSVCLVLTVFAVGRVTTFADLVNNPGAVNNTGYVSVDVCTTVYLSESTVNVDISSSGYSVGSNYPVQFKSDATVILNCSYGDYYYGTEVAYGSVNGTNYNLSGYYYWGSNFSTVTAWETSPTGVNGPTGYCIMSATNTAYLPVPALDTTATYRFNTIASATYVLVTESTEAPVDVSIHAYCSHSQGYNNTVTPGTCTSDGYTTHVCRTCGYTYVDSYVYAPGHTSVPDAAVAPTCTQTGLTAGSHCSACGTVLSAQTVIPATGHTPVTDAAVAPTCTAAGLTEGSHCSVCGAVITAQSTVPANGHNLTIIPYVSPSCLATGNNEYYYCSRCNKYFTSSTCTTETTVAAQTIPASGHNYQNTVVAPTCTNGGYTSHVCSRCGNTYYDDQTSALGHTWGAWTNTTAPTCTADGEDTRECSVCHATETRVAAAAGHTPAAAVNENAVAPNCTEAGSHDEVVYCSVCGTEISRNTVTDPALGHDLVHHAAKAPTCTEAGWAAYDTCSRCDYTTYAAIPASGHTWGEWANTTAPTCTVDGEDTRECSVCHATETRVAAAAGHTPAAAVNEN
ncbi:MAG: hypothetical protein IJS90_09725, partial [Clostridia bacterium]|nr:hypothetical protein [Clostridia bacterium]